MSAISTWLMTIRTDDEDVRRRGRTTVTLALSVIVIALLAIPLALLTPRPLSGLLAIGFGLLAFSAALGLARRGKVTAGGVVLVVALILPTLGTTMMTNRTPSSAFFLVMPILVAGMVLRPWQVWPVVAVVLGGLALAYTVAPSPAAVDPSQASTNYSSGFLLLVVGLLSFLGARVTAGAMRETRAARDAAEQVTADLEQANAALDRRVAERTAELAAALADVEARSAEQARLLEEVEQQRITIRELSVPVLPVTRATLVMPLIGALDTSRLQNLQAQALDAIERAAAKQLLLDITGVPVVDSQVAQGLLAVVGAARLLGAEVVLVGIRPEVAQAVVGLGLDLQAVRTFSDLRTALDAVGQMPGSHHPVTTTT